MINGRLGVFLLHFVIAFFALAGKILNIGGWSYFNTILQNMALIFAQYILLSFLLVSCTSEPPQNGTPMATKPNVILIMTDNQVAEIKNITFVKK